MDFRTSSVFRCTTLHPLISVTFRQVFRDRDKRFARSPQCLLDEPGKLFIERWIKINAFRNRSLRGGWAIMSALAVVLGRHEESDF